MEGEQREEAPAAARVAAVAWEMQAAAAMAEETQMA